MVKHIVMWQLKVQEGDAAAHIKESLEALMGKIPGLIKLEVAKNTQKNQTYDLVLYSEFTDLSALDVYLKHPEHLKAAAYIKENTVARAAADYEI